MVGPRINPSPKHISWVLNMVATLLGNSEAIMENDDVRNPEFPTASKARTRIPAPINIFAPGILSNNPKITQQVPVVNIPALNVRFTPRRFKFEPIKN